MSNEQKTFSNFWNTIDLIGKLVSSVLISGVLGYFIQKGAQEISFSIDSGKLTQSLIIDLATTKKEEQLKQDIALAALDGSIGNRNKYLVANIAERIYMSKSGFSDPTAQYALQVLKLRNEAKYKEITEARIKLVVSQTSKSKPDSNPNSLPPISNPEQVEAVSQIIARTFTGVVFIQFRNAQLKNVSDKIKNELEKQGLEVPPLEQVNDNYSNSIRYFNKEDADLAVKVKAITEDASGSAVVNNFKLVDFSKSGYKIPKGQIEVWIGS